ncbi:hypothetical protein Q75_11615 [Bacillus coahuilensis p1.1.43]|uniref:Uncharacterized protein n=1 Tax=Bacillus coahuilensis p1.1.43 TaxID=1150625 RepID=A0A147K6G9_9BACI|nr:class I SAM-dependent methyltransferase [Bacillus coahuilensis]KUP05489.1 hypothetical protein Q75_11615 [Bacillus coahuilensis p1.1.43]
MNDFTVEGFFNVLDETATIIKEELDITYLEALGETGENMFQGEVIQDNLHDLVKRKLSKQYESVQLSLTAKETIRKSYQLAILKGMKENVQPNHQMTPDSIGLLMTFLLEKFLHEKKELTILDPTVGTGNLLVTIMNRLHETFSLGYGVDVDDVLIRLAYVSANLLEQPIQLYNQDSLEPLFVDPVDVVVSDLPVGYYPNDERAKSFALKANQGHSYAHHLLIEQSINYTKPGGYLFFLIPNGLFESEYAADLRSYLKDEAYIQGILQLPTSLFKNERNAKSILIIQKKAADVRAPKEVLLASLPKMSDMRAMETILNKINEWIKENKM